MTQQFDLFHESLEDALCAVVMGAGGYKRVGNELWPEKPADEAGRLLRHCLTPNRTEKLSLDQLIYLLRKGHEAGIHTAIAYLSETAGYTRPEPITPEDQRNELQRQFIDAVTTLDQIQKRLKAHGGDVRKIG